MCRLIGEFLVVKDANFLYSMHLDAIHPAPVVAVDGLHEELQTALALVKHYPGNLQWLPGCLNMAKWNYSQIKLITHMVESTKSQEQNEEDGDRTADLHNAIDWVKQTKVLLRQFRKCERAVSRMNSARVRDDPKAVQEAYRPLYPAVTDRQKVFNIFARQMRARYAGLSTLPEVPTEMSRTKCTPAAANETVNPSLDAIIFKVYEDRYGFQLPIASNGTPRPFTADEDFPDDNNADCMDGEFQEHNVTWRMECRGK